MTTLVKQIKNWFGKVMVENRIVSYFWRSFVGDVILGLGT